MCPDISIRTHMMCPDTYSLLRVIRKLWPRVTGNITEYVSSYYYICVLILLYMCPHTTICVSSYYYICVLILLHVSSFYYVSSYSSYYYMCVLILLCISPHTTIYLSSFYYICVLMLLYMCPHSARFLLCVLILLYRYCDDSLRMRHQYSRITRIYMSSCYYICVLILFYRYSDDSLRMRIPI